ncbi:hypothetical protein BDQ17DRAFT_1439635 [Cyathus striatus]|nr:hypothetical protein BDQ17DRAFT_1439635 [Cyathus striatus]
MSDIEISPEDLAQCQNIAAKAATEAAARAMADAISQVKAKVAAQRAEEEARRVEEEAKAARRAEEEAEACRPDFPMAPPESFVPHFSTLDVSTAPPSPTPEDEEDELLEENDLPRYDLSAVAAGKRKVVPRPITTFAPASKRRKFFGGGEIPVPLDKITPLPEPTTPSVVASDPEPSSISGYHLRDRSTTSAPASTSQPTCSKDLSRTRAYRALLAAELEQVEYAQNCIAVVRCLQDIAFLHSPEHLHLIEGLDPDFTRDSLANLKEMADELTPWLPKPDAISALETALERAFALHTFNLRATSTVDIVEFPNAKETVAIKDFAKSLKPRNLGKLGGVFGNRQLYPLSLEDYSGGSPGPSGSSSVRATRGGNTEHEVDLGRED